MYNLEYGEFGYMFYVHVERNKYALLFYSSQLDHLDSFPGHINGGSDGKASAYSAGDPGSIPGSGICPGEGNGNPLQCFCLENPMDDGTW